MSSITIQAQLGLDNTGNVGIGTTTPNNKLEIKANAADASGLRFTNLTSNSPTQPIGSKVLSVDAQGNVILIPTTASAGGAVPTSGIIMSETEPNATLVNSGFSIYGAMNFSFNAYNTASPIYRYLSNTATTNLLPSLTTGGLHTAIWTGTKMIVYGGFTTNYNSSPYGASYDPIANAWTNITSIPVNAGQRMSHSAVWTGSKMILFGGRYGFSGFSGNLGTLTDYGASYDPTTNAWIAISATNAPIPRDRHTAVWTGNKMIIWGGSIVTGGSGSTNTGGIYDSVTDAWTTISTVNAPSNRGCVNGVWTGSKFIVWGGCINPNSSGGGLNTGGIYDPSTDTWTTTSMTNVPTARVDNVTVWTGSRMIVFGGTVASGSSSSGGIYDPSTDSWTTLNVTNAPTNAVNGVWTGSKMLVWGNSTDGGLYDPVTNTWTKVEGSGTIPPVGSKAVWTGTQMITNQGGVGGEIIGLSPFQLSTTKKLFLYKKD